MQRHPLKAILGRPALHLIFALAAAIAFFWPIFAMTRPTDTFHFLHTSWLLSLVLLFAVSRGSPADPADAAEAIEPEQDAH